MFSLTRRVALSQVRSYSTTVATPKKVGAFRGGILGFLFGVTLAGAGSYYYLLDEYKVANSVVIADVVALQNSISNLEKHVKALEESKK